MWPGGRGEWGKLLLSSTKEMKRAYIVDTPILQLKMGKMANKLERGSKVMVWVTWCISFLELL